jgi:NAD(P)-dependent dehydrogenase (short-subunit alcohol dehydrogenase family)
MNIDLTPLHGRTAVITGAASGFGRELARLGAASDMQLALTDVDRAGLDETLSLCGLPADRAFVARCDVSNADEVERLAQAARARFGAIHLLCNNAGVIAAGPAWKATPQDWA